MPVLKLDAQALGEIYLCQLCGDVTFHSTNQKNPGKLCMKQIFQDLLAEIVQMYYAPNQCSVSSVDFLLKPQQTLSREYAETVLTSNDLTENFLMSEETGKFKYSRNLF